MESYRITQIVRPATAKATGEFVVVVRLQDGQERGLALPEAPLGDLSRLLQAQQALRHGLVLSFAVPASPLAVQSVSTASHTPGSVVVTLEGSDGRRTTMAMDRANAVQWRDELSALIDAMPRPH
jgi:hypothetical protein